MGLSFWCGISSTGHIDRFQGEFRLITTDTKLWAFVFEDDQKIPMMIEGVTRVELILAIQALVRS